MKNLTNKISGDIADIFVDDYINLPTIVLSKIKNEILVSIKKYAKVSKNNLKMSLKLLNSGKFVIDLNCVIDGFCNHTNIF